MILGSYGYLSPATNPSSYPLTAQSYAKLLKIDKAHVFRMSGFKKEDEFEIERDVVSDEIIRKPVASKTTGNAL